VRAWHEVKAQAAEVARIAQELAGHVRDWLDRTADRVLDRLGGDQGELALAGGPEVQEATSDFAALLRGAWEAHQETTESEAPERETPEDLAARLRGAFSGVDRDALSERLTAYRQEREADELSTAQEQQRQKDLEREQEERHATRDRGHGHGL